MRTRRLTAIVLSLALCAITGFAGRVTVNNVTASQRQNGNVKYVDIYYDLANPSGGLHEVIVEVSTNGSAAYVVRNSTNMSGAVGLGVSVGTQKQVEWFAHYSGSDLATGNYPNARVRVTANDDLALIPAGAFQMGTNNLPFESEMNDAGPNHSVYVSAFWMDKYEVTSQKWFEVRNWALAHNYTFDNNGSGKGATHPAQTMSWWDCVKWCNARSEMEGLTPCYYTNAAQTLVYRGGQSNLSNEWVKWTANGYRLPTEAEWEKAARGGVSGRRFPWSDSDEIQHARANYYSSSTYTYDTSPTRNSHPTFATGNTPYTSPAGYFAPNGYGLYDMAGNVHEWCWDWYDSTWYSKAGATQVDTRGPGSGTYRVLRGGAWGSNAYGCRVALRFSLTPVTAGSNFGFRCVRR